MPTFPQDALQTALQRQVGTQQRNMPRPQGQQQGQIQGQNRQQAQPQTTTGQVSGSLGQPAVPQVRGPGQRFTGQATPGAPTSSVSPTAPKQAAPVQQSAPGTKAPQQFSGSSIQGQIDQMTKQYQNDAALMGRLKNIPEGTNSKEYQAAAERVAEFNNKMPGMQQQLAQSNIQQAVAAATGGQQPPQQAGATAQSGPSPMNWDAMVAADPTAPGNAQSQVKAKESLPTYTDRNGWAVSNGRTLTKQDLLSNFTAQEIDELARNYNSFISQQAPSGTSVNPVHISGANDPLTADFANFVNTQISTQNQANHFSQVTDPRTGQTSWQDVSSVYGGALSPQENPGAWSYTNPGGVKDGASSSGYQLPTYRGPGQVFTGEQAPQTMNAGGAGSIAPDPAEMLKYQQSQPWFQEAVRAGQINADGTPVTQQPIGSQGQPSMGQTAPTSPIGGQESSQLTIPTDQRSILDQARQMALAAGNYGWRDPNEPVRMTADGALVNATGEQIWTGSGFMPTEFGASPHRPGETSVDGKIPSTSTIQQGTNNSQPSGPITSGRQSSSVTIQPAQTSTTAGMLGLTSATTTGAAASGTVPATATQPITNQSQIDQLVDQYKQAMFYIQSNNNVVNGSQTPEYLKATQSASDLWSQIQWLQSNPNSTLPSNTTSFTGASTSSMPQQPTTEPGGYSGGVPTTPTTSTTPGTSTPGSSTGGSWTVGSGTYPNQASGSGSSTTSGSETSAGTPSVPSTVSSETWDADAYQKLYEAIQNQIQTNETPGTWGQSYNNLLADKNLNTLHSVPTEAWNTISQLMKTREQTPISIQDRVGTSGQAAPTVNAPQWSDVFQNYRPEDSASLFQNLKPYQNQAQQGLSDDLTKQLQYGMTGAPEAMYKNLYGQATADLDWQADRARQAWAAENARRFGAGGSSAPGISTPMEQQRGDIERAIMSEYAKAGLGAAEGAAKFGQQYTTMAADELAKQRTYGLDKTTAQATNIQQQANNRLQALMQQQQGIAAQTGQQIDVAKLREQAWQETLSDQLSRETARQQVATQGTQLSENARQFNADQQRQFASLASQLGLGAMGELTQRGTAEYGSDVDRFNARQNNRDALMAAMAMAVTRSNPGSGTNLNVNTVGTQQAASQPVWTNQANPPSNAQVIPVGKTLQEVAGNDNTPNRWAAWTGTQWVDAVTGRAWGT